MSPFKLIRVEVSLGKIRITQVLSLFISEEDAEKMLRRGYLVTEKNHIYTARQAGKEFCSCLRQSKQKVN